MMNDEMMSARNATVRELLQSAASGAFLSAVTKLGAAGMNKLSEWESPIGRKVDYAADRAEFDALRRLGIGDLPLSIGDYVALKHGDAERWNEFVRRATRQNPQAVEVLQGRALPDTDAAGKGYRSTEAEEDAERRGEDADAGKDLTGEQKSDTVLSNGNISAVFSMRDNTSLTRSQLVRVNTYLNIAHDHLKESDFSGTLRDLQGDPVPNGKGGYYHHMEEMIDSYRGLVKIERSLRNSLNNPTLPRESREYLQGVVSQINRYITRINDLFAPYGGVPDEGKDDR